MATARWFTHDAEFTGEGAPLTFDAPPPKLLDALAATVHQAFSTRKLREVYAGPALRVRRSSDSTETDIGFTDEGDLDTAALLAFAGVGDALVRTWYDQSGNGRNMAQSTAAAQPQFVVAGVLNAVGGKAAPKFASPRHLRGAAPSMLTRTVSGGFSSSMVLTHPATTGAGVVTYGESGESPQL